MGMCDPVSEYCRNVVEWGLFSSDAQVNIMDMLEDSGDVPGNTNTTTASKVYIHNLCFQQGSDKVERTTVHNVG
jgi:hypothetical protein